MLIMLRSFLLLVIFSISARAMEEDDFHRPYIKDEVQKMIDAQIRAYEQCLLHNLMEGVCEGIMMPLLATFALGGYLGYSQDDPKAGMEKISNAMKGGVITTLGLAPFSIALALPLAIFGLGYASVKFIIDGVKASTHEAEFKHELALYICQWIEVVKRGRLAIRQKLKDIENNLPPGENFLLANKTLQLLQGNTFNHYFNETELSVEQLTALLNNIDDAHNSWENLFPEVSRRVKTPALNEAQWQKLELHLIGSCAHENLPKLSECDVKEYLPFAVYFFTLANEKHLTMLKHFSEHL